MQREGGKCTHLRAERIPRGAEMVAEEAATGRGITPARSPASPALPPYLLPAASPRQPPGEGGSGRASHPRAEAALPLLSGLMMEGAIWSLSTGQAAVRCAAGGSGGARREGARGEHSGGTGSGASLARRSAPSRVRGRRERERLGEARPRGGARLVHSTELDGLYPLSRHGQGWAASQLAGRGEKCGCSRKPACSIVRGRPRIAARSGEQQVPPNVLKTELRLPRALETIQSAASLTKISAAGGGGEMLSLAGS